MIVNLSGWLGKVKEPVIKSFLQSGVLPDFGIVGRAWLPNVNVEKVVIGINQGKEYQAESSFVVMEKAP
jgi:hypothetical protein